MTQPSKLDIAVDHIDAAIRMIALGLNPYTVHLAAMASSEIIVSVAQYLKKPVYHDIAICVKPAYRNEVRNKLNASYNFFKHADRDPDKNYEGPIGDELKKINDLSLSLSIVALHELGHSYPGHFNSFTALVGILYGGLFDADAFVEIPLLGNLVTDLSGNIDRALFEQTLRMYLFG